MELTTDCGLREYGDTNNSLNIILKKIFPFDEFLHNKVFKIDNKSIVTKFGTTFRPDYVCHNLKLVVEFDGDSINRRGHFSDSYIIMLDNIKTEIIKKNGYSVIRIPPYIQLDSLMIKYFFNKEINEQLYGTANEHGFLHKEILLPGSFVKEGLNRFENDLNEFPSEVIKKITDTLLFRKELLINSGFSNEEATKIVYYRI